MIIECPACSKKFNIDEKLIPKEGRLLKCGNCDHTWFYKKEENLKLITIMRVWLGLILKNYVMKI